MTDPSSPITPKMKRSVRTGSFALFFFVIIATGFFGTVGAILPPIVALLLLGLDAVRAHRRGHGARRRRRDRPQLLADLLPRDGVRSPVERADRLQLADGEADEHEARGRVAQEAVRVEDRAEHPPHADEHRVPADAPYVREAPRVEQQREQPRERLAQRPALLRRAAAAASSRAKPPTYDRSTKSSRLSKPPSRQTSSR